MSPGPGQPQTGQGRTPLVPAGQPCAPSNLPEKLSVALQRFFFLFLFLASGMSMGWLEGMSVRGQSLSPPCQPPGQPPQPAGQGEVPAACGVGREEAAGAHRGAEGTRS